MKGRLLKKCVVFLMGIAMIVSLLGCSEGTGSDTEVAGMADGNKRIATFDYRVSGFGSDYYIGIRDGKITYSNREEGIDEKKCKAKDNTILAVSDLINRLDIESWDGFKGVEEGMLDGSGFSLFITFEDGTSITASGENSFPEKYNEFDNGIREVIEPFFLG